MIRYVFFLLLLFLAGCSNIMQLTDPNFWLQGYSVSDGYLVGIGYSEDTNDSNKALNDAAYHIAWQQKFASVKNILEYSEFSKLLKYNPKPDDELLQTVRKNLTQIGEFKDGNGIWVIAGVTYDLLPINRNSKYFVLKKESLVRDSEFDQSNYYIGVATYEGNIRDTYQLAFKFAIKNAVEVMRNQDTIDKYYVKRFFYDRINGNFECHVIKTKEKI